MGKVGLLVRRPTASKSYFQIFCRDNDFYYDWYGGNRTPTSIPFNDKDNVYLIVGPKELLKWQE